MPPGGPNCNEAETGCLRRGAESRRYVTLAATAGLWQNCHVTLAGASSSPAILRLSRPPVPRGAAMSDRAADPPPPIPRPDRQEVIADGVVHAVGIALALAGLGLMATDRGVWSSPGGAAAALLYGCVLVAGLAVSMTYNLWPEGERKQFLRRCDHAAIFLLIAATYTPFLERALDHREAQVMLAVIWVLALAGVAIKTRQPLERHRLSVGLYLAMGWSGLVVLGPISSSVPAVSLTLIVVGGAIYSLGVIFHVWERLRFQMAIWHGFVVAAAMVHYSAVLAAFHMP